MKANIPLFECDKCKEKYSHEPTAKRCCLYRSHKPRAKRSKTKKTPEEMKAYNRQRYLENRDVILIKKKESYIKKISK